MEIVTEAFTDYTGSWEHTIMLFSAIAVVCGAVGMFVMSVDKNWVWFWLFTSLVGFGIFLFATSMNNVDNQRDTSRAELEATLTEAGFDNLDIDYGAKSFTASKNGEYIRCGFLPITDNTYELACNPG